MKPEAAEEYTRPFAPFVWLLACRCPRGKKEGVAIAALFASVAIMLAAATPIAAQQPAYDFPKELGALYALYTLNGHVTVRRAERPVHQRR